MLNINAVKKPSTLNPFTKCSVNNIILALMMSKKKPKEKIVNGIVKKTKMGFNTAFRKDNTAATMM
jgi:hypothetical protein